jgi:hypothetical protein
VMIGCNIGVALDAYAMFLCALLLWSFASVGTAEADALNGGDMIRVAAG